MDQEFFQSGALFKQGDQVIIGWGESEWSTEPSKTASHSFYFPRFFLSEEKPWLCFQQTKELSLDEARKRWPILDSEEKVSRKWTPPSKGLFHQRFCRLKELLDSEQLVKAVPYLFAERGDAIDPSEREQMIAAFLSKSDTLSPYGFWNEDGGLLGATPELLFDKKGNVLHTMALAGTLGHHEDTDAFLNDPKERREHQIVVESISRELEPFGTVRVGEIGLQKAGALYHLKTEIALQLNADPSFKDLVSALHPTPALGAYPKEEGQEWLKGYNRLEPRGRYGAPAGVYSKERDQTTLVVAIRGVQWDKEHSRLGIGAGVISESRFDSEWEELLRKMRASLEVMGLG